jgi:hypothetical protein
MGALSGVISAPSVVSPVLLGVAPAGRLWPGALPQQWRRAAPAAARVLRGAG